MNIEHGNISSEAGIVLENSLKKSGISKIVDENLFAARDIIYSIMDDMEWVSNGKEIGNIEFADRILVEANNENLAPDVAITIKSIARTIIEIHNNLNNKTIH